MGDICLPLLTPTVWKVSRTAGLVPERALGWIPPRPPDRRSPRNRVRPIVQAYPLLHHGVMDERAEYLDSSENLCRQVHERAARPQAGMRLGRILLEARLIDAPALQRALRVQGVDRSRHLGRILLDQGVLQPAQLDEALAMQSGIPCVRPAAMAIAADAIAPLSAELALRHRVMPLARCGSTLVVAMPNPFDTAALEALRFHTGMEIAPALAPAADIALAQARHYSRIDEEASPRLESDGRESGPAVDDPALQAMQPPVVRLLDTLLREAVLLGASDINIRPEPGRIAIHHRIDGRMREVRALRRTLLPALISRIKIVGGMNIAERRLAQDGGARFRCEERMVDLRMSVVPTVDGESAVIRILDRAAALRSLERLGLRAGDRDRVARIVRAPHGLFLVCGPTGAGKSTTLYAVLNELRGRGLHLLTAEDPVEYRMDGVEQVQIAERIGYTFPEVLRRFLRHDPDVIMIGEIRDAETAAIACRAALTGHFVLSSLHTNDAPGAVLRLIDLGVAPYIVAAVLRGVMAQRLLRLRCAACRQGSATCTVCGGSGYAGRRLVCEVLEVDSALAALIEVGAGAQQLAACAMRAGMGTLADHARDLLAQGLTTVDEVAALVPGAGGESGEGTGGEVGKGTGKAPGRVGLPCEPDAAQAEASVTGGDPCAPTIRRAAATPLRTAPSSVAG